ncbi:MAG: DNA polymerase III subunit gamma/tau [Candidatus Liptonbacteria bacterium]|nr:DNA polymerase III subunit gamma/tau [Candidatus Liptonbacteria bacterium]
MALAFYRKYRPKKLEEVIGQESTIEILRSAAGQGRLGHAYLFYGPRGTGKTTTARLVAKLLNCERRHLDTDFRKIGEPCNACQACRDIDGGMAFDLIEIDAASNRGIDEIRNLKEGIHASPTGGRFKVYIIDEAHMLTGPAFNALLKTLEEPPRHAVLILATTEYEKLPATITSRTQRFLFKKLSKIKIMEKLHAIANAERIAVDPEALELIAASGEGSVRDAESLLDQIRSLETKINLTAVERITGRVGFKKVTALAEFILKKDLRGSLDHLSQMNEEGHNVVQLAKDLIHYLRRIIAFKMNPSLEKYFHTELTGEEIKKVKELSALMDSETGIPLIRALIRAYSEMRYSPFAMIPLEIALVEHLDKK